MPTHQSYTLRNYKTISNVVLFGTYLTTIAITGLLLIRLNIGRSPSTLGPLAVCGLALAYIVATHVLLRRGYHHAVAYLLLLFYTLLAAGIVWTWGVNTPMGTLILGLVIVLAGILLTAHWALYAALMSTAILMGTQTAVTFKWHMQTMPTAGGSSFGEALAYCTAFAMLALVSWLYNREMERSLAQAKQAEIALLQQKATLKMQVKERTAELRKVQLEEMQYMYHFAELGQLGVTLLHDMANHLSALTLEMEGLQSGPHPKATARAELIIGYLENLVNSTRERLQGSTQQQTFDIGRKISETIAFLHDKAAKANVVIQWHPPARSWKYKGDAASLCQVIAIITNNAIDAYKDSDGATSARRVIVTIHRNRNSIVIHINDWGKGITKSARRHLFKPLHSAKKSGLGLGLYIAKQTIEMQFQGTIIIDPQLEHTRFTINLPLTHGTK